MGDGVSDLSLREELPLEELEELVRNNIRAGNGCIVWWPGGRHHYAICSLLQKGEVEKTDVSGSQETKFEIRFAEGYS